MMNTRHFVSSKSLPVRYGRVLIIIITAALFALSLEINKTTPDLVDFADSSERNEAGNNAQLSTLHPRIAIVQYTGSVDTLSEGHEAAISVVQKYARLHGYYHYVFTEQSVKVDSVISDELEKFGYHKHHWRKPFYLSTMIREGKHEWLTYLDTDVVITDPTQRLEAWIDSVDVHKTQMIITDDPNGICNGIFFQRASNWSLEFNQLWWSERQAISKLGHDNWPFMSALLKSWAVHANYSYDDECSMARRADMESWDNFYPCYSKHVGKMGRTTHPSGCTKDFPDPCGSAYRGESPIVAKWGLNKGYGFSGKNYWTPGSFMLHLAGHPDRDRLLLQHAAKALEKLSSDPVETDPDDNHHVDDVVLKPAIYHRRGKLITVWPISFSAPEEMWVPVVSQKSRGFAVIIPGNLSTYIYEDEDTYYKGYR